MDRSQGLAGGHERGDLVACRAGGILPQSDDRQEADDPDHDDDGLRNATGDVAESDPLVLSLDDRLKRDRGPDDCDREDDLEERPQEHLRVVC